MDPSQDFMTTVPIDSPDERAAVMDRLKALWEIRNDIRALMEVGKFVKTNVERSALVALKK